MRLMMTRMARMKESWCLMPLWWWCKVHDNIDSCTGVSCHLHRFIILQRFYHTYEMPLSFQCNIDLRIFHCNCFEVLIQYWFSGGIGKGSSRWKKVKRVKLQMEIFWNIPHFLFHYSGKFECPLVQIAGGVFIQYSKVEFKLQNTLQLHWNDITCQLSNCLNGMEISFRIELPIIYSIPLLCT